MILLTGGQGDFDGLQTLFRTTQYLELLHAVYVRPLGGRCYVELECSYGARDAHDVATSKFDVFSLGQGQGERSKALDMRAADLAAVQEQRTAEMMLFVVRTANGELQK